MTLSSKITSDTPKVDTPETNDHSIGIPEERLTLRKKEKLRHKNLVNPLFSTGKSLYDFPIRMVYRILSPEELSVAFRNGIPENTGSLQMLITVPKKKCRHAVDRVRIRRRIREAYRLNRLPLYDVIAGNPDIGAVNLAFIFIASDDFSYAKIEKSMIKLLKRVGSECRNFKSV